MIFFTPLTVDCMREHGMHLLQEDHEELYNHDGKFPLDVDWNGYLAAEAAGMLNAIALWNDDQMVGYSVFIVSPHMHSRQVIGAVSDVFFLSKPYRRGRLGLRLIDETERTLKSRGVSFILWHCRYGHPLGNILKKKGYQAEEYEMSKFLI